MSPSRLKRILAVVAVILGSVGGLACMALVIGSLVIDSKLNAVTRSIYSDADDLFSRTRERFQRIEKVLSEAKFTTSDLEDKLAEKLSGAAEERVSGLSKLQFGLGAKANDLAVALAKADSFAEMSTNSVSLVIRGADVANQAGAKIDTSGLESLQQEIGRLSNSLDAAIVDVNNFSAGLRDEGEVAPTRERLVAAAELAVRVLATLEDVQSRFQRLDEMLGTLQQSVIDSKPKLLGRIHLATTIAVLLLLWSFAGQCALGYNGWRTVRR
jgi:hypothetical protein